MRAQQAVVDFLRDLLREHPARPHGQCPTCGHVGADCHGSRAAKLLADLVAVNGQRHTSEQAIVTRRQLEASTALLAKIVSDKADAQLGRRCAPGQKMCGCTLHVGPGSHDTVICCRPAGHVGPHSDGWPREWQ